MAEHVVKITTSACGSRSRGICQSCPWSGPVRTNPGQASHDAALHADQMARQGEGKGQ